MAKTYITTDNSRGKQESVANPTFAHIRGWDVGVRVNISPDGDELDIYMTAGSNGGLPDKLVGVVTLEDGSPTFRAKV